MIKKNVRRFAAGGCFMNKKKARRFAAGGYAYKEDKL
jgi:hypothetical protein